MLDKSVLDEIIEEREYQKSRWGGYDHDKHHSPNDWIAFITGYLGKAWTDPLEKSIYRKNLIKVAALAIAAIDVIDKEE